MFLLALVACVDGSLPTDVSALPDRALSVDTVTTLARGDASGSDWSGQYQVEIRTTDCEGTCGVVGESLFTVSFCDVGDVDIEYFQVVQEDGLVEVEVNDPISFYRGGVYTDGTVDLGGYATENGGAIDMTARLLGHFEDDLLLGTASALFVGPYGDTDVDCRGTFEVEGDRAYLER